jgi:hypothetical protein
VLGELAKGADLAGGDRSTRSWPWQRKEGDTELVRVHWSLTYPRVGSTCSAVTRGSRGNRGVAMKEQR